jgi:ABC-type glycerol-3-phosphate transport system permease component
MSRKALTRLIPNYVILSLFLLIILLPIIGLILSAFKTDTEVIKGPFALPSQWNP